MTAFNNSYNQKLELTLEQERCLNYHMGDKTLMIKGYAGAGKSVVLQTTALKYINMYPEGKREHKIGIFTYTNALTTTTREILDANVGGKDVFTSTLDKYLIDLYKVMGGPYKKMYDGKIRDDNIRLALETHERKRGTHRFHKLSTEFWEDEIDWMKGMNISPDDLNYYLALPRKGRGSSVRMSAADRLIAFEIFRTYCEIIGKKGCGDWADFPVFINKKLREYEEKKAGGLSPKYPIPDEFMFDMILIDEAQDLSLAQMLASMGLYRKAMVIAMDAHQRIYLANWSPKQLGIETQTQWLTKSMRNTIEIDALAESLRKKNEEYLGGEETSRRAIPIRHGDKPVICGLADQAEERTYVISQIKRWLSESSEIRIGVIGSSKKQVEQYSSWCTDAGIHPEIIGKGFTFSMKTPGVKILNAYNAKGLEFFRVIIPQFNEGNFPFKIKSEDTDDIELALIQFRSLAYVAMTRAQESLIITYSGNKPSRFIEEMDSSLFINTGSVSRASSVHKSAIKSTRSASALESKKSVIDFTTVSKVTSKGKSAGTGKSSNCSTLISFFTGKGFKCVDKRSNTGGSLWVIGSREELAPIVREAKNLFGDLGNNNFAEHGGKATNHQAAWFMTADK